jgi:alkylated DNA repair dioxygenase AlkB
LKENQVIANWYEDKNDYIASHADCQKCMIDDAKISIISLYPNNDITNFRFLEIKPKQTTNSLADIFKIRLDHGSIITMCGTTQDEFVHGVSKTNLDVLPRISLSFRQMINKPLRDN